MVFLSNFHTTTFSMVLHTRIQNHSRFSTIQSLTHRSTLTQSDKRRFDPNCSDTLRKNPNSYQSSLTGVAKIWSMPGVKIVSSLKGHAERATDVKFSPTNDQIATASADRTAKLWNTEGTLLNTYKGHLDRLARIAFHPSGKYLGTTSFDKTWRLWDIETGDELLLQEGHSRSVYGLAFHPDGSLAASCGLDALARVWDLRSGRSILALEGHVKPVFGISFSPNGYHLATGGEDNTCRIWDLRKKRSLYTIPAHANLISDIKFKSQEGYFLVTASYDMIAKMGKVLPLFLMTGL